MQSNPLSNQNSKQLHEARQNLLEQVKMGFADLTFVLVEKKNCASLSQSLSWVMQNQSKRKLLSTQVKIALLQKKKKKNQSKRELLSTLK